MLRLLLVAAVCVAVRAAKYCCVPDQWEGTVGLIEGADTPGQPTFVKGGVRISYDYKNNRLAELVNITANGVNVHQKLIMDYTKNVQYTIVEEQKKCVMSKPPPLARCVPDTARETGSFYFGVGNNVLKNRAFEIDLPAMQTTAVVSVTQEDCVPVTEAAYGSRNGVPFIVTLGYVNITPGIKDPSVFNVPSYCSQSDLKVGLYERKTDIFWLDYLHARLGFFQNV